MIDGNLAMNSHFESMSEKDSNDMADHYISDLVKKGMKDISDKFLQYLDEDIHDGKNLLQSAKSDEERTHIASAISTLHDVKEKYLQLLNNQINESKG